MNSRSPTFRALVVLGLLLVMGGCATQATPTRRAPTQRQALRQAPSPASNPSVDEGPIHDAPPPQYGNEVVLGPPVTAAR